MPRFDTLEGAVRWDIDRELRRGRRRLRTSAAVVSVLALCLIAAIAVANLRVLRVTEEHQTRSTRGTDPLGVPAGWRLKAERASTSRRAAEMPRVIHSDDQRRSDGGGGETAEDDVVRGSREGRLAPPLVVHARVRVHVVVEHAARIEMLLFRDPSGDVWGPCVGTATTNARPTNDASSRWDLAADVTVRRAAAAALLDQAGLGQPPDIEFMQALDRGGGGGGEGPAGEAAVVYVALVRAERLRAGAGGLRGHSRTGGSGSGGSRESRAAALDVALRGTGEGRAGVGGGEGEAAEHDEASLVTFAPGLREDVDVLRRFLDPWVITVGKDPGTVCKDPKELAARAGAADQVF